MSERGNVLVTGGAGFIGSHLVDELLATGDGLVIVVDDMRMGSKDNLSAHLADPRLAVYDADVADPATMSDILNEHRVDAICHLATSLLVASITEPQEVVDNIYGMQQTLLELMRREQFGRLVSFSTSEVYGSSDGLVLDENSRLSPQTPYAAAKAAADLLVRAYAQTFPDITKNTTIIRPFNNFGPRKRVLAGGGIIPQTITALHEGRPVTLSGGGTAQREFVYVEDTAAAVCAVLDNPRSSADELFVVATGQPRSMRSVVEDIAAIMSVEPQIEITPPRPGDVSYLCGNGSKIKRVLGFEPRTPWQEGLRACVEYYRDNPDAVAHV